MKNSDSIDNRKVVRIPRDYVADIQMLQKSTDEALGCAMETGRFPNSTFLTGAIMGPIVKLAEYTPVPLRLAFEALRAADEEHPQNIRTELALFAELLEEFISHCEYEGC